MPALLLLVLAAGCGDRDTGARDAPTIDVPPALTVDTANDPQAIEEEPVLVGVLPNDFPADLPIYVPASLIDFGTGARGRRSVSLLTSHPVGQVRRGLDELMREREWVAGDRPQGEESGTRWRKGANEVWLRFEDARPGTRYVFEY